MRNFAGYFVGIGLVCAACPARAQHAPALSVERAAGAEGCPDADALGARVAAIRGAEPNGPARYTVTFAREGEVYSTQIRSEAGSADVRRIEDRGTDCSALAQATALTLALLYDADAARTSAPQPPSVTRPAPITAAAVPAAAHADAQAPRFV